ncbi:MAG: hypothetical protein DRI77_02350 [Chloroflexi bacterium]|nr:MAG: hypothetical protein DRI77_02350 [Chloroflexota bacterium]
MTVQIGLALSGGGAKGIAHVGVLKVLEEAQIPVHVLAGTSMGGIVAAAYAAGLSPAEIEQFFRSLRLLDMDQIDTTIKAGEEAARQCLPELLALRDTPLPNRWARWWRSLRSSHISRQDVQ